MQPSHAPSKQNRHNLVDVDYLSSTIPKMPQETRKKLAENFHLETPAVLTTIVSILFERIFPFFLNSLPPLLDRVRTAANVERCHERKWKKMQKTRCQYSHYGIDDVGEERSSANRLVARVFYFILFSRVSLIN